MQSVRLSMSIEIFSNECFDDLIAISDYIDYFSGKDVRTAQIFFGILCEKKKGEPPTLMDLLRDTL